MKLYKTRTNFVPVASKVRLPSYTPWYKARHSEHRRPLGYLVWLYCWHDHHFLHHRQCHPSLWWARVPNRRASWYSLVLSAL